MKTINLIHRAWFKISSVLLDVHTHPIYNIHMYFAFYIGIDLFYFTEKTTKNRDKNTQITNAWILLQYILTSSHSLISRVPGQNGTSLACYIVKIYHCGPEPLIWKKETFTLGVVLCTIQGDLVLLKLNKLIFLSVCLSVSAPPISFTQARSAHLFLSLSVCLSLLPLPFSFFLSPPPPLSLSLSSLSLSFFFTVPS